MQATEWKQLFSEKIEKPFHAVQSAVMCAVNSDCGGYPAEMFKTCTDLDNCPCTFRMAS